MSTTTLTFEEGTSSKFYTLEISDTTLIVRFGRIGSQGQAKTTKFKSTELATKEYARLLTEKKKKGYVEAAGAGAPKATKVPAKKTAAGAKTTAAAKPAAAAKAPPGPPAPALDDPPVVGLDLEPWRSGPLPVPERDETPLPTGDFVACGYTIAFGEDDEVLITDAKGKKLKSVPAKLRATDDYQSLMRGRKDDRGRGKRARRVLEERMISGSPIGAAEIAWLVHDDAFADLLKGLIVVPKGSAPVLLLGWEESRGLGVLPLDYDARWIGWHDLQIPHPIHLEGVTAWQDVLVELGLSQALVQAFREIKTVPAAQRNLYECTMLANRETRSAAAVERILMDDGWITRRGHAKRTLTLREGETPVTVEAWFDYGEYYMPSDETTTGAFGVNDERGRPLKMSDVPKVLLGEIIRSLEVALAQAGAKKDGDDDESDEGESEDGDADGDSDSD
jgi:predicted DNA-binding WGR domain protein